MLKLCGAVVEGFLCATVNTAFKPAISSRGSCRSGAKILAMATENSGCGRRVGFTTFADRSVTGRVIWDGTGNGVKGKNRDSGAREIANANRVVITIDHSILRIVTMFGMDP